MLLYANTSVFVWKSIVFWFCTVWYLHMRCEMRHFYTLRCAAPFWLIQCKPYRNRFITAKVIDKSLGARFLWPTVYKQCWCWQLYSNTSLTNIHRVTKRKPPTNLLARNVSNLNQFSKFFHCWKEDEYFQQNCVIFSTIFYSAVKEFWKLVKIWESYCQKFGGFLFGGHGV